MKLGKNVKIAVSGLCIAATLAGAALPTLAVSPAGYTSLSQIEEMNDAVTPEQVEALINQIGPITLDSATAIANAQGAYAALPDEWKAMVSNYATLELAQEELEDLQVSALAEVLNKGFYREYDDVEGTDYFFWKGAPLTDQTNMVFPYFCMTSSGIEPIRIIYSTYGSSWIFWDTIIYSFDGEVYEKKLDYFDVMRKSVKEILTNNVYTWERADDIADKKEIELLRRISKTEKPTIRFKGSNYKKDIRLDRYNEWPKSINNFFEAYDAFISFSPEIREKALEKVEVHKMGSKLSRLAY